jgi:uncharacterized protein with von Willebrand factor type A (vWA) domain
MLVRFFFLLKSAGIPVTITELLTLLEALKAGLSDTSAERFYFLARTCLVKDERHYDRFDKAFAAHFKGAQDLFALLERELPADWLTKLAERELTDEEKAQASGRQQVDRHGRHLALRRLRLQPRGRAHRAGQIAQWKRGQGMG